jgi:hypothetical protein
VVLKGESTSDYYSLIFFLRDITDTSALSITSAGAMLPAPFKLVHYAFTTYDYAETRCLNDKIFKNPPHLPCR